MLNAPKPVHINIGTGAAATGLDASAANGATLVPQLYAPYVAVPDGGNDALRITIPGVGAGADPSIGERSTWRKASWIAISNLEAAGGAALEVSFDNGNNFMRIAPATTFTAALAFRFFFLRGVGGGATNIQVNCIVGINQT